jgi:hypothetical protein
VIESRRGDGVVAANTTSRPLVAFEDQHCFAAFCQKRGRNKGINAASNNDDVGI